MSGGLGRAQVGFSEAGLIGACWRMQGFCFSLVVALEWLELGSFLVSLAVEMSLEWVIDAVFESGADRPETMMVGWVF